MKTRNFFRALAVALLCTGIASAAEQPIQDGAQMFSATTASQLNQDISAFTAQTGKQIVVVTVPSLNGKALSDAAEEVFQQQNINGMLIFIARDDRKDFFLPDTATAEFFPESTITSIRQSMESLFKSEDYDGGISAAVSGVLNVFRAHLSSAPANGAANNYPVATSPHRYIRRASGGISHVFIWIIFVVIGYLVLRSIFRAMSGPRYYGGGAGVPPGGAGPGGPGYGGPGYGGYGYGPGYYGGGGGGFWSGLLGGLGGAWLGNEMFGNRGNTIIEQPGGNMMPTDQGGQAGSWGGGDAGGWTNDAGQADMGAGSGGDWGGGGFGGGGDFGGGGFGGGGDSGGGW